MNEREISELRRRLRHDKASITQVCGCYVSQKGEILSRFSQPVSVLDEEDSQRILNLLKKAMSGTLGKNLVDISFSTRQVLEGQQHKLLMALRDGGTQKEEILEVFYEKVTQSVHLETDYLILLAADAYDVPKKDKNDQLLEDSDEVFRYILCCICPAKLSKTSLAFDTGENKLCPRPVSLLIGSPELGFTFPAFDNRSANIYGALYYCRNLSENQGDFITTLFDTQPPMPAAIQKESFQSILGLSLEEECSLETVQAVQDQLVAMIQEHKESKEPEVLTITKGTVKGVLASCGVSEERVAAFDREYEGVFGEGADLQPGNVIDPKRLELKTPDVTIKVNPDRPDLVETRIIDGARYVLVRAEEGVEVNGVSIQIEESAVQPQ